MARRVVPNSVVAGSVALPKADGSHSVGYSTYRSIEASRRAIWASVSAIPSLRPFFVLSERGLLSGAVNPGRCPRCFFVREKLCRLFLHFRQRAARMVPLSPCQARIFHDRHSICFTIGRPIAVKTRGTI